MNEKLEFVIEFDSEALIMLHIYHHDYFCTNTTDAMLDAIRFHLSA
jgi:hypothetical protein